MILLLLTLAEALFASAAQLYTYDVPLRYVSMTGFTRDQLTALLYHALPWQHTEVLGHTHAMERLQSHLTAIQADSLQSLSSIGLVVRPEPRLDFGIQHFCEPAIRFVQIWANCDVNVTVVDAGGLEAQIRVVRGDFGGSALKEGEMLTLKVVLFPMRAGQVNTQMVIRTELGAAAYEISAFIKDNVYRLRPVTLPTAKSVSLRNPDQAPLEVLDIFSMNSHLVILSDEKYPWVLPSNHTKQLFVATFLNSTEPGTVVVRTNQTNLYIAVRAHLVSVVPVGIRFGVVNTSKMRHKVPLLVSNWDESGVKITRISTDSPYVLPLLQDTNLPPHTANLTAAYVYFHPRQEGYFAGSLRLFLNTTTVPIVIPYTGYALYGFIGWNRSDFAFHRSEQLSRPVSLTLNFPVPLHCLSIRSPKPLFAIESYKRGRVLFPFLPLLMLKLVPLVPYEYSGVRYLSVETEVGVVGLPAAVEDGTMRCTIASTFEPCFFQNRLELGEKRKGEKHKLVLLVENSGELELELSLGCSEPCFEAYFTDMDTDLQQTLLSLGNCSEGRTFVPFPHSKKAALTVLLSIPSGKTQATLELSCFYHTYKFTFVWQAVGEAVLFPAQIHWEALYSGPVQSVNLTLYHTYTTPVLLLGWTSSLPGLQFHPTVGVVPRDRTIVLGQVSFAVQLAPEQSFEFTQEVTPAEFSVWEHYRQRSVSMSVSACLHLFFTVPYPLQFTLNAVIHSPVLTASALPFGFVDPYKVSSRFVKVENPTDQPVIVEALLLSDRTDTESETVGEIVRRQTQAKLGVAAQSFFLHADTQVTYLIPAHDKAVIGPIQFSPSHSGYRSSTLLLRNNLTYFAAVRLTGEMVNSYLHFPLVLDLTDPALCCCPRLKSLTFTNLGSMPMLISDLTLDNGDCIGHGAVLARCHTAQLLYPSETFETEIRFRPGFQATSLDLIVVTEAEKLQYPIQFLVDSETTREPCDPLRWIALSLLETLCVGVVLSAAQDCAYHRSSKRSDLTRLSVISDASVTPPTPDIEKKKVKKHKKRKVPPIILDSLPAKVESEGTCKKEAPATFADPTSNKSTIVGESMLEGKVSDSEDYLDEYKQSGLFSGFALPCEE